MTFDFTRFSEVAASVYNEGNPYPLEDVLEIFREYFREYELHMGHAHPAIRASQVARIVLDMPWIFQNALSPQYADIAPDQYKAIIRRHFETKYRRCDYNINHFFSGKIREMRFYEACYRGE